MSASIRLALGDHALGRALTDELAAGHGVTFERADVRPINRAFAPMIRERRFDVSELAIVSAMQALAFDKPLVLLPVTVAGRFQHGCLLHNREHGPLTPEALPGRRVGVRAYAQTTGAWVRAILQRDYDVAPLSMRWVTQEGSHVAEYRDPPAVERVGMDRDLTAMLAEGEIDAAIYGLAMPEEDWIAPVIAQPDAAARVSWERAGVVPINHLVAVSRDFAEADPARLRAVFDLFSIARSRLAPPEEGPDFLPLGFSAMRPSVEALLSSAHDQGLIPRRLTVEEMFEPAMAILGDAAA